MKSLKIIQVLVKVFKIIFFVCFILCIVGAAGCLIAMIVVPIVSTIPVEEGKTVADVMAEHGIQFTLLLVELPSVYSLVESISSSIRSMKNYSLMN